MTVVRPHLQWGVAELGDGDRVDGFVEKPRSEHWINGGFFCFEPGALDYLDERERAGARAARTAGRRRPAARPPPRGLLGLHGHLQGRGRAQRPLGRRRGALATADRGRCAVSSDAGQRRPRLRRLAPGAGAAGARRRRCACSTARRHASPTSAASAAPGSTCSGSASEVELVEADLRDAEAVAAAVAGVGLRLPSRRPDDRRRRPRVAAGDLRGQRAGRLERLRGLPRARGRAGRLRLLRQGLRLEPRAALPRGLPAARRLSLRRQQGGGRHDRAQLRERLRPAAGGDPLRQRLRRWRPQLLPPDPRDGGRGARRPARR